MSKDNIILRELASRYFDIANSDTNLKNIVMHKNVNDLKGERPIVLIDEIPFNEMNIDNKLTLYCENEQNRRIEWFFKTEIFKWDYFRCDMVLRPYYNVQKIINSTGIGISSTDNDDFSDASTKIYKNQIETIEDIENLRYEKISYNEQETFQNFEKASNIFGDILPIKICGEPTGYNLGLKTIDDIVTLRGLDSFFFDFIEKPEFMHLLITKLTDIFIDKIRQFNELNLFDGDAYYIHGTSALTNDLEKNYTHPTSKNVWGRGLAQIFGSVSPEMHSEFDTKYMIKALKQFGLVYYGCCEPLDKKIDILEQIPNLRKISITPWADINNAAEIIGDKYVIASKPNPSTLATYALDEANLKSELSNIVSACRRNNCSADIVLKDITTVNNKPENLFKWAKIAMDTVNS